MCCYNTIIYFKKSFFLKGVLFLRTKTTNSKVHETHAQLDNVLKIINSRNNHAQFTINQFKTVINKEKPIENCVEFSSQTCKNYSQQMYHASSSSLFFRTILGINCRHDEWEEENNYKSVNANDSLQ